MNNISFVIDYYTEDFLFSSLILSIFITFEQINSKSSSSAIASDIINKCHISEFLIFQCFASIFLNFIQYFFKNILKISIIKIVNFKSLEIKLKSIYAEELSVPSKKSEYSIPNCFVSSILIDWQKLKLL